MTERVLVPRELVLFLLGEGPLNGIEFGEQVGTRGRYWWRTNLRKAMLSAAEAEAQQKAVTSKREYLIRTVADFLAVPPEKIPECISDFAQFLQLGRNAAKMNKEMSSLVGIKEGVYFDTSVFHWVDDGRDGMSAVEFKTPDGKDIGRIEFPEVKP